MREAICYGVAALCILSIAGSPSMAAPMTVDTIAVANTFVREASPGESFGGLGALSVAGSGALDGNGLLVGLADTFLKFNTASVVASLDTQFGANHWTITSVALGLVETATPPRDIFGRGQGTFQTRWLVTDAWSDAGIIWNNKDTILNAALDVPVGEFTNAFDGNQHTPIQLFDLAMATSLLDDIQSGGDVSFLLTATSPSIGATFNSKYITGTRPKPFLEITAVPEPCTLCLLLAGAALLHGRGPGARTRRRAASRAE
jgi:hypothetical protein